MTAVELAAIIAGYAMALARVANAARWAWGWAPPWAQILLPALVTALPVLASQMGGAPTKLEIVEALVVFLGALGTAWRGSLPGKPDDKDPPTGEKPVGLVVGAAVLAMAGCAAKNEPPPCDPASYATLAAMCGDDVAECERAISERETYCAKLIAEEP